MDATLRFRTRLLERLTGAAPGSGGPASAVVERVGSKDTVVTTATAWPRVNTPAEPADLDGDTREAIASAWSAAALGEIAKADAFAALAMDLGALGAPPKLVDAANRAALDEVRHARLCLSLAEAYAGHAIDLADPTARTSAPAADLIELAVTVARERCVGDTLAAVLAADQLASATDPAVRRTLVAIATDEELHAELAWTVLAWAVERGGQSARDAVAEAFEEAAPCGRSSSVGLIAYAPSSRTDLAAHGVLDADACERSLAHALREVVLPCAQAYEQALVA